MKKRLVPLALSFIKLGFVAFGGPAAAYAMMHQEFVSRMKWLREDEFFDFLGIANLVPGPNATEMAILIGHHHAGVWGLVVAGVCYILPAMVIVLSLAWVYVQFGTLPGLESLLYGIKPVVVAILISAMWGMLKPRLKNFTGLVVMVGVFVAYLFGISPVLLLIGGGILTGTFRFIHHPGNDNILSILWLMLPLGTARYVLENASFDLMRLFLVFLKAGALMLGSGYVLLAFIYDDLVVRLGWLTDSQMVDAIAVGQVTPGPLSTTATFVGYVLGGLPAALLATLAMFLPSFLLIGIVVPVIDKIRASEKFTAVLEGVNFAALGLMAGVSWEISSTVLVDPLAGVIALVALVLLVLFDMQAPWLILAGAAIGLLRGFMFR